MDAVTAIALAGGALYVATRKDGTAPAPSTAHADPPPAGKTSGASNLTSLSASMKEATNRLTSAASTFLSSKQTGSGYSSGVEEKVMAKAKAEWQSLDAAARKKACEALKKANPTAPSIQKLPCDASFDTITKAIAAAGATAACAATGAGTVVSPLCGAAGAWIAGWAGPKLKDWTNSAGSAVKNAVGSVGAAIGEAFTGGGVSIHDRLVEYPACVKAGQTDPAKKTTHTEAKCRARYNP